MTIYNTNVQIAGSTPSYQVDSSVVANNLAAAIAKLANFTQSGAADPTPSQRESEVQGMLIQIAKVPGMMDTVIADLAGKGIDLEAELESVLSTSGWTLACFEIQRGKSTAKAADDSSAKSDIDADGRRRASMLHHAMYGKGAGDDASVMHTLKSMAQNPELLAATIKAFNDGPGRKEGVSLEEALKACLTGDDLTLAFEILGKPLNTGTAQPNAPAEPQAPAPQQPSYVVPSFFVPNAVCPMPAPANVDPQAMLGIIEANFNLVDTAAGGPRDAHLSNADLCALLNNPDVPAAVKQAVRFLLRNPAYQNMVNADHAQAPSVPQAPHGCQSWSASEEAHLGTVVQGADNQSFSGMSVEDMVVMLLMRIMNEKDKEITEQANKLKTLNASTPESGEGGATSGAIDEQAMVLKRMTEKRGQLFDMLKGIINAYDKTAEGIIRDLQS